MNLFSSKNKKGIINDVMAIVIVLCFFGLVSIFAYTLYDEFVDNATEAGLMDSPEAIKAEAGFRRGMNLYDPILVLIMAALIVSIGISSYTIATPAVFFLVTFIMSIFTGLISFYFNFFFQVTVSEAIFAGVLNHFPMTLIICSNLHWVSLIALVIGSITLYAKRDRGQFV